MKRAAALQPLSRDHHHALVLARALRRAAKGDAAARRAAWSRLGTALAGWLGEHVAAEERHLAPYCTPTERERLLREHAALRAGADGAGATGGTAGSGGTGLRALGELLQTHVRWEERVLFPRLETALDAPTLDAVGRALAEQGPRPWDDGACPG